MRSAGGLDLTRTDARITSVDAAVRSVLRELPRGVETQRANTEVFPERLLALRHVEALAPGLREIWIGSDTVVTPLARDELKLRSVAIRWVSNRELGTTRSVGDWGFLIEEESGVLTALRRSFLGESLPWRELGTFEETVQWVSEAEDRGAFVLSNDGALAVWQACRVDAVRAASAETCVSVVRAIERLGVNLLVVEPAGKPLALLKQLAMSFRRAGAPRKPSFGIGEAR